MSPTGALTIPEGIEPFAIWAMMWKLPLCRYYSKTDGTTKTKLRLIALLETPLKLIESIAVDQHANHIVAPLQARHVGFRAKDGA